MVKIKNYNKRYQYAFVCASAILGLGLGAGVSDQVKAAESPNTDVPSTQVNTKYDSSTIVQDNSIANSVDNQEQIDKNQSKLSAVNADEKQVDKNLPQAVEDKTKVVIHYDGDADKWKIWAWSKDPAGNGTEYDWDGTDDYGHYKVIDLKGNASEVGVLIKDKDWNKETSGNDRIVKVDPSGKAEVWYKSGSDQAQDVTPTFDQANIKVHYISNEDSAKVNLRTDKDDENSWKELDLTKTDGELQGLITMKGEDFSKLYLKIADSTQASEFTPLPGDLTDIYMVAGDSQLYYSKSFAVSKYSITSAELNSGKTIMITTGEAMSMKEAEKAITVTNNQIDHITPIGARDENDKVKTFAVNTKDYIDLSLKNLIGINSVYRLIDTNKYLLSDEFDERFYYDGDDLGANYTKDETTIKLWAPTAHEVTLNVYNNVDNSSAPTSEFKMTKGDKGIWTYTLTGDYQNWAYDYKLFFAGGKVNISNDPYSKAVTINGKRSVIEDYDAIKPSDFKRMDSFGDSTKAVIYETSVRDFTSDPNANIEHAGKFLGMIESGKTADGQVTGLDYLKELGITHVQIMPSYDFASIDEAIKSPQYNWGYDPQNYNVPEGSYSTNPADPKARIMEMKQMIDGLHKAGIRVVMDVVYNHVFDPNKQAFELTVPGYYYQRYDNGEMTNGTGCGNDVFSDRKMMRKYIVDSVKYWANTYNVDGFRFDLMGMLDFLTMNKVRSELNKIDPGILVYGEGWEMRKVHERNSAAQRNAWEMDNNIGYFSDDIRNAIKGSDYGGVTPGLVEGNLSDVQKFIDAFLGGQNLRHHYKAPTQTVNYVAVHDNRTLYDLIKHVMPGESEENIIKRDKLATSMVMLAQGIPLFHSGQEALRTKHDNENSYNAPIEINQIDWNRIKANKAVVDYFKDLVNVRRSNADAFAKTNYDEINKTIKTIRDGRDGVLAFEYRLDNRWMYVAFNLNNHDAQLNVDLSKGSKLIDSDGNTVLANNTTLKPLSTLVVQQMKTPEELNKTQVVIHYQGNGRVWEPYVWSEGAEEPGKQYHWDGEDENGHFVTIELTGDLKEVGILIKKLNVWDKDGSGENRMFQVDPDGRVEVFFKEGEDKDQKTPAKYDQASVKINYKGFDAVKQVNVWTDTNDQKQTVDLSDTDGFKTGSLELKGDNFSKIFIAPVGVDTLVREFTPTPGKLSDLYLVANTETGYYNDNRANNQYETVKDQEPSQIDWSKIEEAVKPDKPVKPDQPVTPDKPGQPKSDDVVQPSVDPVVVPAVETPTLPTTTIELTHNTYVYLLEQGLLKADRSKLLPAGTKIEPVAGTTIFVLDGKQYYQIDAGKYIKLVNTISDHNDVIAMIKASPILDNLGRATGKIAYRGQEFKINHNNRLFVKNGKTYYAINNSEYVEVGDAMILAKIRHNSYVYNSQGKAIRRGLKPVKIKAGTSIFLMNEMKPITVNGKRFYQIGENSYIKMANVDI